MILIEARLLCRLLRASGAIVSCDALRLMAHEDDPDGGVADHALKVYVFYIRRRAIKGHGLLFDIRT